jgi:pyochelin biosynthetic protein PchC
MRRAGWFLFPRAGGDCRVFLFHHAAGATHNYLPLAAQFGTGLEPVLVELPGRGFRIRERRLEDMDVLASALTAPLLQEARAPYALVGHSLGALVAYEMAHRLCKAGRPPAHLVVSAVRSPRQVEADNLRDEPEADLPRLARHLAELGGTPRELLDSPEFVAFVCDILRSDLRLMRSFRRGERPPLPCPITALGGDQDGAVPPEVLADWRPETAAAFAVRVLPGGHFYLNENPARFADELALALAAPGAAGRTAS